MMKTIFKNKNLLSKGSLILFMGLILCATACKKAKNGEDGGGNTSPQITKVYLQGDADKTAITSALPGKYIVIVGQNLGGAQTVAFDSKVVNVDAMANTETTIVVQIPADATPNPNGVIKVTSAKGTASFNFGIAAPPVPAPVITSISNENANAGETVTITGQNLGTVTAIKLPGNNTVSSLTINTEGTKITYTAPNMGSASGKMQLVSSAGNTETAFDVNLSTGDYYLISNLDPKSYYNNQTAPVVNDATLFPGNRGKYLRHNLAAIPSNNGAYWNGGEARRAAFSNIPVWNVADNAADLASLPDNYALKFEINTRTVWSNPIHCVFFFNGTVNDSNYGLPNAGGPLVFGAVFKPVPDTETFNTANKWITITIPLASFKNAYSPGVGDLRHPNGNTMTSLGQIIKSDGKLPYFEYRFYTVGADNNAAAASAPMDVAFDNFRIVKIK